MLFNLKSFCSRLLSKFPRRNWNCCALTTEKERKEKHSSVKWEVNARRHGREEEKERMGGLGSLSLAWENQVRSHTCLWIERKKSWTKKDGRAALNRMQTGGWTNGITRNNFFGFFFFFFLLLEIHPHFLLIIDEVCGDRRCTLRLMFVLLQLFFVLFCFFYLRVSFSSPLVFFKSIMSSRGAKRGQRWGMGGNEQVYAFIFQSRC